MVNPRQRRKARSSSHRPVSSSRRAKKKLKKTPPIRGPELLQNGWDKKKTVRQNYVTLGLVHTLNPIASGGHEIQESTTSILADKSISVPMEYGRIVRDDAGNAVQVELAPEESEYLSNGISEAMAEPDIMAGVKEKWVTKLGKQSDREFQSENNDMIKELERKSVILRDDKTMSLQLTGIGGRKSSASEVRYLRRLVDKYGDNVERMARDRKVNNEQRTVGELERALKRSGLLTGGREGDREKAGSSGTMLGGS
ncbi:hypothetical protein M378DRAFT_97337 [Amanita muscaria Koide BX008]|uniref:Nucleolar protein 16 n=1 Tax=Amanita muscaria (strain Koide BX008) TaxID=946122 RepID=A0A0C2XJI9_AMAMK|nr:hypothetical protein M378DRAFT_97337 [Amanita muscaria Koide BX008]